MSLSLRQPMLFPTSRRSASLPLPSSVAWGRHVSRYLSWECESGCFQVCVGALMSAAWKWECAVNLDTDVEFCLMARDEAYVGNISTGVFARVCECFSVDLVLRLVLDECDQLCSVCVFLFVLSTAICLWSFSQCQDWKPPPSSSSSLLILLSLCHSHLRDDRRSKKPVNRQKRWSDGKRRTDCFGCTVLSDLTS